MKKIALTKGRYALVDDGDFEQLSQYKWYFSGGYVARGNNKTTIYMHRDILGPKKNQEVDHLNHDGLDNQRSNLRVCTRTQNSYNTKLRTDNKSGYKGVIKWTDPKTGTTYWRTQLFKGNKALYTKYHKNVLVAAKDYNRMAKNLFGKFAFLNEVS